MNGLVEKIRERLKTCDLNSVYMNSACGEYNCDCHRDMPAVLDLIQKKDAALRHVLAGLEGIAFDERLKEANLLQGNLIPRLIKITEEAMEK